MTLKYNEAFCVGIGNLTIYKVREFNFDENNDFDSNSKDFLCPDEECQKQTHGKCKITTVNADAVRYKQPPHFRDTKNTVHRDNCPYASEKTSIDEEASSKTNNSKKYKEGNFPTEFTLTKRKYKRKDDALKDDELEPKTHITNSKTASTKTRGKNTSANKTSSFEHIIECHVSNMDDKEKLKSIPLTINNLKYNYWTYFKKIQYFKDREGLIYWGEIKEIKDYDHSFRIDFLEKIYEDEKLYTISLYIKKSVIDSYYKKTRFKTEIREAKANLNDEFCFFYGAYPEIKTAEYKGKEFKVYNIEIENLDHLLIRKISTTEK